MAAPLRTGRTPYSEVWDKVRKRPDRKHLIGQVGTVESAYNTASRLRTRDRKLLKGIRVWTEGTNIYAKVA